MINQSNFFPINDYLNQKKFLRFLKKTLLIQLYFMFLPLILSSNSLYSSEKITDPLHYFRREEPQIFNFWSDLSTDQKLDLEQQLIRIDLELLKMQKELLKQTMTLTEGNFESFNEFSFSGDKDNTLLGQKLIEEGRLGCLLLAGGQGTRLKHSGAKGTYPISIIKQKSLFELCAEKVAAASRQANRPLRLAIMTSPENDSETRDFFKEHHFFGLDPAQVSFFQQGVLPLLDADGKLFLKTPSQLNVGADGNGHALLCFAQSGILDEWMQQGIEYLHVILIDNPLADPYDAELLGFHFSQKSEMTLKCTEKTYPEEKVGLFVKQNDSCRVIEYSEMSQEEKFAYRPDGRLKHCCANLSLFCFSLSCVKHLTSTIQSLPLHKAWKATESIDSKGNFLPLDQPIAWKFETFIFDWLLYIEKVSALIYPREECFAPLKNYTGSDSPETVRQALQGRDRKIIETLTGVAAPEFSFELASDFYYPTEALRIKWKGRAVTSSYVEP